MTLAFCHHQILEVGFMGFWCSRATAWKGRTRPDFNLGSQRGSLEMEFINIYIYIHPLNRVVTYLRYLFIRPSIRVYVSYNSIYKNRRGPPSNALSVPLQLFHPENQRSYFTLLVTWPVTWAHLVWLNNTL